MKKTGIALAEEIKNVCQESITDLEVMTSASRFLIESGIDFSDNVAKLLYKYSGILASTVATKVISVTLAQAEIEAMIEDIQMMEGIRDEVLGKGN